MNDVPSPCIDVCELDQHNVCLGCLRSSDEIMAWPTLSVEGKRGVLRRIARRRAGGSPAPVANAPIFDGRNDKS